MKSLSSILAGIKVNEIIGNKDIFIKSIVLNSNDVRDGYAFVAVRGTNQDGNNFIDDAISRGSKLIISDIIPTKILDGITYLVIYDIRNSLGLLASNFYDDPSSKIEIVGITGTNGKTSIATLLYDLFIMLGKSAGLISTINIGIKGKVIDSSKNTTPDIFTINLSLKDMVDNNCSHCFMEVSSHGIDQGRIDGIKFKLGIFTNISQDHLDYHLSFKNYINTKKKFFDSLNKDSLCLINKDDRNHKIMIQNTRSKKYFYSLYSKADFNSKIIESTLEGTKLFINGNELWTPLKGRFNIYNLLAVYGACYLLLGDKMEKDIFNYISMLKGVKGRFDCILTKDKVLVVIDYAHTPEALKSILECLRELLGKNAKLINLIGCGGNRDKSKRSKMGKISYLNSDIAIFTSDNPRFEKTIDIIEDMKKELSEDEKRNIFVLEDRREAIELSNDLSKSGDIVLIAGKGHEPYQQIKGVNYRFDDLEVAKEIFNCN